MTAHDMIQAIYSFNSALEAKSLSINCVKSKLLRFGPSLNTPVQWPVYDSHGHTVGNIQKVHEVTYLGVQIGIGRLFSTHLQHLTTSAKCKVAQDKAKALQSMDRIGVAQALWLFQARQALLHGVGAIPVMVPALKSLEISQLRMAKWILGVSKSTSTKLVRTFLRWTSLLTEIHSYQLVLWARISHMPQSGWPKVVLLDMIEHGAGFQWLNSVHRMVTEYKLSLASLPAHDRDSYI